jgi:hypothetical protein
MSVDGGIRDVLERAELVSEELVNILLRLSTSRTFEGSDADRSLRQALAELSSFRGRRVFDEGWVELIRRAEELVSAALAELSDPEIRESVTDVVGFLQSLRSSAIDRLVERDPRAVFSEQRGAPADAEPYVASAGSPAAQRGVAVAVPRLFAAPDAPVADDDPEDESNDDAATELRPLRRERGGKSQGGTPRERMMVEALARDAMEDLGAFANLRQCFDDEAWSNAEPFERRLLGCLDALTSTARPVVAGRAELDLAEALFGYATEWSVPDRGRAFAFAFTLATLPQDTALLWVEMGLKSADVRVHPAYVDALALARSPAIDARIRGLLAGDVPRDVMLAGLQAALRRGLFHAGTMLSLLAHPDATIAELATLATSCAKTPVLVEALATRDSEARLVVRGAQALALSLHGERRGHTLAREVGERALAVRDELAARRALRALVLHADNADHELVWQLVELTRRYRDAGFFGHAPHVPRLFAVVEALDRRMVGADLEPGKVDLFMTQSVDCAAAIRRISKLDLPRFGSGRFDVEAGETMVSAWQPAMPGRLRFDGMFDRLGVARELRDDKTQQGERLVLTDELAFHSQGAYRLDPTAWVAEQRTLLDMVIDAWNR